MSRALSTLNTTTEMRSLSKAPNPQLLPVAALAAHCSVCVCVFTAVCALGWVKCRAQISSMGHHTWPHVTSSLLSLELQFIVIVFDVNSLDRLFMAAKQNNN